MASTPRVLVVGAGFGGLATVKSLADKPLAVELVDRRNHHLFQPLLYQVATAGLEPSDIAYAVRGVVSSWDNVAFTAAEITGIDLDGRTLTTAGGRHLAYDYLVLAAGARTADFGVPGVAEHAFGLKSLDDAVGLRQHLLCMFEQCSADPSLVADGLLDVVVVGGGPTGVETAGAVSELYDRVLSNDFPELDLGRARVSLVEMADRPLTSFHAKLQQHAVEQLRARGIELHLGQTVASVDGSAVTLGSGQRLPAGTCVWAAGVEAQPLGEQLGLATGRGGRIEVREDLSVPGHPEIFVIGDLAAATDKHGNLLPQVAPVAMQQGRYVARCIAKREAGKRTRRFRYVDKGTMATIGRRAAVAQVPGGIRMSGTLAWLAWLVLHIYFLIGFRNRASVLLNWAWNYLTWDRAARVVNGPVAPGSGT